MSGNHHESWAHGPICPIYTQNRRQGPKNHRGITLLNTLLWVEIYALQKICRNRDHTHTHNALWGQGRWPCRNTFARFFRERLAGGGELSCTPIKIGNEGMQTTCRGNLET